MNGWMHHARRHLPIALMALALLGLPAASSGTTSLWPTYHLNPGRSGNDAKEPSFQTMKASWTVGPLDGAIYAEPLVSGNDVIVATENDSVYALAANSGAVIWHTKLGNPRTSNFPCGNIVPLGITGTPVIDHGFLYVLAETQTTPTTFTFRLAKIAVATGHVAYNRNVTPAGMITNTEQERSALNVSQGNVVIAWGGLSGDCGTYHGYVETVAESSGAVRAAWHDTPTDNQGGIWGPSGPAVNSAGNIFVTTGNGSSTTVTEYDYGDSVLDFSPSLVLSSFFAPGPPQQWSSLNADDADLASIGPSLLSGGLIFAIGKGGRGYLLSQGGLPSDSNPGGGENFSAQVCHQTSGAAFGGLAVSGATVLVPCADGIVAVNIDSATSFHVVWYSSTASGPPILAGGLIWAASVDGGTTLYGLNPTTGATTVQLHLPQKTEHFATPASGDGKLFIGDGTDVEAFGP
jgi:outer membrane protein assembly factor BamB